MATDEKVMKTKMGGTYKYHPTGSTVTRFVFMSKTARS